VACCKYKEIRNITLSIIYNGLGGTSFEDKRKVNYDKGQAELDRRRKLLEDMANREREERERKEREEFEKAEKIRLISNFDF